MRNLDTVSWGNPSFDKMTGGLPAKLISVIETPDYHTGNIILGQFLYDGLLKGERCALVTFDTPISFFENFAVWDLNFRPHLVAEKFFFLSYQPNIAYEAGLTHDYDQLLNEIRVMCGGHMPDRLAFQQIDTLVNLNNQLLISSSTQKLSGAARSADRHGSTILGQFVNFNDQTHKDLAVAFQKTAHGYFSLTQPDPMISTQYQFLTRKLPWFDFLRHPSAVKLVEGEGFRSEDAHRNRVA